MRLSVLLIFLLFLKVITCEVTNTSESSLTTTPVNSTTKPLELNITRPELVDDDDAIDDDNDDEEDDSTQFSVPQDAMEFMDYFDNLLKRIQSSLDGVFDQYLPQLFEMSSSLVLSSDCTYDIVRVMLAIREMKPWAIKREFLFRIRLN